MWQAPLKKAVSPGSQHLLTESVCAAAGSPYGDAGDPRTAWELAWDCDLVITTFDYMSHKWDARAPVTCSPLMQVGVGL